MCQRRTNSPAARRCCAACEVYAPGDLLCQAHSPPRKSCCERTGEGDALPLSSRSEPHLSVTAPTMEPERICPGTGTVNSVVRKKGSGREAERVIICLHTTLGSFY